MLRKLLPLLLSLAAFLGGAAGGEMLRRSPIEPGAAAEAAAEHAGGAEGGHEPGAATTPASHGGAAEQAEPAAGAHPAGHGAPSGDNSSRAGGHGGEEVPATAWFEFPQQFLVPILHDRRLDSTMILTLSLELPGSARETVHAHEIKLRDALLRQLLIHANTGGFDGNFTSESQLRKLRTELVAAVRNVVPEISDVLIGDIGRQER